jgi:3-hydroxyacyl-CoA dehydrogenase/enoyl-CoA hydratase/3-hydroxybutyryl-CoA epimerase/enoyl-CoA isomerase
MIFQSKTLRVEEIENGILELKFCAPKSVNVLNTTTLKSLDEALDAISQFADLKGLMLTSDKESFIVGADIYEFCALFHSPEEILDRQLQVANQILNKLEELPVPTVSVLHGYALGGGCECVLATDFRIGDSSTQIGLPEIKLGIMPGFGGCVRLPRVIGADNAIEAIIQGKIFKAEQALKIGLLDTVVPTQNLFEVAKKTLTQAIQDRLDWQNKRQEKQSALILPTSEQLMTFSIAKGLVKQKVSTHYKAPYQVVKTIEASANQCRNDALQTERQHFLALAKSDQATALISIYLNDQYIKNTVKKACSSLKNPVRHSAVIGAGVMGGSIALQSAIKGIPVMLKDISESSLKLGTEHISQFLEQGVEQGKYTSHTITNTLSSIHTTLTYTEMEKIDVAIEAVNEDVQIKSSVLKELEEKTPSQTIITSNTSTIPISYLAKSLSRPENFCGMHFFNPVHKMPLVEVIRGKQTSDSTISTVVAFASMLGKTPVVVNDCPGFFVNRVLFPYLLAFCQLVEEGHDFVHIDQIMEDEFGWPMGPGYLLDVVGLDIACHAQKVMCDAYPDRMTPEKDNIVLKMYAAKKLGQKSGEGFYQYQTDAKGKTKKTPSMDVYRLLPSQSNILRIKETQTIINRMMIPMINEVILCLEENIIQSPAEADIALVYGLGFPPFRGGVCRYLDTIGISEFIDQAQSYQSLGVPYQIPRFLQKMVTANEVFYPIPALSTGSERGH